jgi:hypothetical protein
LVHHLTVTTRQYIKYYLIDRTNEPKAARLELEKVAKRLVEMVRVFHKKAPAFFLIGA